jgi:hypothetical protein
MRSDALRAFGALLVVAALAFVVARGDAGSGQAMVHVVSATGAASATHSPAGDVVLRAGEMKPRDRATGTVTVSNDGEATGAFRLAQTEVLDVPGPAGGRLSTTLRLAVENARDGTPIYRGVLGAMDEQPLGYLRPGEERTYRFTVTSPAVAADRADAGSRVETTFDLTAATGEPPREGEPDRTPPSVVISTVRAQGDTVIVALTGSERCTVARVAGGKALGPPAELRPGRPALTRIRLTGPEAGLRVTVADAAGNRTTAGP